MRYRQMKLTDYEGVISLWQTSAGVRLRDADSRDGIEKYLKRNPNLSFVCEKEGEIVGTIMSGHDGKRGYVQHLAVAAQLNNKGIGSELIERCLSGLEVQGIVKSHIHVLANNKPAQAFWANRGWQERVDLKVYSHINDNSLNT